MFSNFAGWHALILVAYVGFIALALWLLYTIIRLAVRTGMRQHQEWLDQRKPDSSL